MRGFTDAEGWHKWIDHHKARWWDMVQAGLDVWQIWTNDIINGDYTAIRIAVKEFGLKWDEEAVDKFVEPKFWKRWAA
jgi:hypothetical protein